MTFAFIVNLLFYSLFFLGKEQKMTSSKSWFYMIFWKELGKLKDQLKAKDLLDKKKL